MNFIFGLLMGGLIATAVMSLVTFRRYNIYIDVYRKCIDRWEQATDSAGKIIWENPNTDIIEIERIMVDALERTKDDMYKFML